MNISGRIAVGVLCLSLVAAQGSAANQDSANIAPKVLTDALLHEPSLERLVWPHSRASDSTSSDVLLLVSVVLDEGGSSAWEGRVHLNGRATSGRHRVDVAFQGYSESFLASATLDDVMAFSVEPPPSQTIVSIADLTLVSFWRHGRWDTRYYETSQLPTSVRRLFRSLAFDRFIDPR